MGYNRSENDVTKLPFFSIIFAIAEIFCGKFSPTDRLQTFSSMCHYTRLSSSHRSHLFIPTTSFTLHTLSPLPLLLSLPVCLVITCVATGEERWCVCVLQLPRSPNITDDDYLVPIHTHRLASNKFFRTIPLSSLFLIPMIYPLYFKHTHDASSIFVL